MGGLLRQSPAAELGDGSFDFGLSSIHVGDPTSLHALSEILEEHESGGVHECARAGHGVTMSR